MSVFLRPLADRGGQVAVGAARLGGATLPGRLRNADRAGCGDEQFEDVLQLFPVGGVEVDFEE